MSKQYAPPATAHPWRAYKSSRQVADYMARRAAGEPICDACGTGLMGCAKCQPDGERYCPRCNQCEACGHKENR